MYLYIIIFLFYLLLHSHSFVNYYGTVSGNGTCGPLIHLLVGLILHFMLTFLWLTTLCRELWDITEKDMDLDHRELRDSCELRFVFVQQTNLECIIVWLGLSKCTICSFFCCFVLGFFFFLLLQFLWDISHRQKMYLYGGIRYFGTQTTIDKW